MKRCVDAERTVFTLLSTVVAGRVLAVSRNANYMTSFVHFVITRMNIKWKYPADVAHMEKNDKWLENRLELFKRFCFPSIMQQTCTNFTWLLYLDVDTPVTVRVQLENLVNQKSTEIEVLLRYVEDYDAMIRDVGELVSGRGQAPRVLTTRIDNDDAFHFGAIAAIQEAAAHHLACSEARQFAINLCRGYDIGIEHPDTSHNIQLFRTQLPVNMFVSLMERDTQVCIRTVYFCQHIHMHLQGFPVYEVAKGAYWLRVIHGGNVANTSSPGVPLWNVACLQEFALDTAEFAVDRTAYLRNSARWLKAIAGKNVRKLLPGWRKPRRGWL